MLIVGIAVVNGLVIYMKRKTRNEKEGEIDQCRRFYFKVEKVYERQRKNEIRGSQIKYAKEYI